MRRRAIETTFWNAIKICCECFKLPFTHLAASLDQYPDIWGQNNFSVLMSIYHFGRISLKQLHTVQSVWGPRVRKSKVTFSRGFHWFSYWNKINKIIKVLPSLVGNCRCKSRSFSMKWFLELYFSILFLFGSPQLLFIFLGKTQFFWFPVFTLSWFHRPAGKPSVVWPNK